VTETGESGVCRLIGDTTVLRLVVRVMESPPGLSLKSPDCSNVSIFCLLLDKILSYFVILTFALLGSLI
jgi:hypothetical protein